MSNALISFSTIFVAVAIVFVLFVTIESLKNPVTGIEPQGAELRSATGCLCPILVTLIDFLAIEVSNLDLTSQLLGWMSTV